MSLDQKRLSKWISDRCAELPVPKSFVLLHATVESAPMGMSGDLQEVILRKTPSEGSPEREGEKIGRELWEAASLHAEAYAGTEQRYKVCAEAEQETLATLPFTIGMRQRSTLGDLGGSGSFMQSEPATTQGLLGMLMRHLDNKERTHMEALHAVLGPLVATNQTLHERCKSFEEERIDILDTLEKLASNKHERDIEMIKTANRIENRDKIVGKLSEDLIPRLVKQFFGDKAPAGLPGADAAAAQNGKGEKNVAYYQERMRDVFKLVDKRAIQSCLSDEACGTLDGLLGIGTDPKDVAAYKRDFMGVMTELPREVLDALIERLTTEHPDKAAVFADLFSGQGSAPS